MHRRAFPACPVLGPTDPVPFGHLGLVGSVPRKCDACSQLFEGKCLRGMKTLGRYLDLDHGSCGIAVDTAPVVFQRAGVTDEIEVPAKCAECPHLRLDSIREWNNGMWSRAFDGS